jgi:prepilin-type N-terminal cleavage/methylation domain-containing protein
MKYLHGDQGFSLLEVMIALVIFSISIVALYGIQTRTIVQNYTASRITTADTWASKKIEELIALKYEDVTDTDGDGTGGLSHDTTATADGSQTSPDGVYTVLWNVAGTDAAGVPLPNTKIVRIIVTSSRAGTGNRVDLEYIKAVESI